jgi:hypothetical protein
VHFDWAKILVAFWRRAENVRFRWESAITLRINTPRPRVIMDAASFFATIAFRLLSRYYFRFREEKTSNPATAAASRIIEPGSGT